jgi:hypothetical protein
MKILHQKSREVSFICVQYDGLQYKPKNKTFKEGNYLMALNFALTLPDMYIMSCEKDIYDWAVENKHPIINKKSWEFW